MKKFCVYTHSQNGVIFYVGCCAIYPYKRGVRSKYQRAYSKLGHSVNWLLIADKGYEVTIVFESNSRDKAFVKEVELIGENRLTIVNIALGGAGASGVKDSDEIRRKKSITKLAKLNPMYGKRGADSPRSRAVRDAATGFIYESVLLAATAHDLKMKTLYNWLSGHRKNPTMLEFAK